MSRRNRSLPPVHAESGPGSRAKVTTRVHIKGRLAWRPFVFNAVQLHSPASRTQFFPAALAA